MRHESCFCQHCGHYNADAGVVVDKQADEIARLREALEIITETERTLLKDSPLVHSKDWQRGMNDAWLSAASIARKALEGSK